MKGNEQDCICDKSKESEESEELVSSTFTTTYTTYEYTKEEIIREIIHYSRQLVLCRWWKFEKKSECINRLSFWVSQLNKLESVSK